MKNTISNVQLFTATLKTDSSVNFTVVAVSESLARQQALDKIGYAIAHDGTGYVIVDADDPTLVEQAISGCASLVEAYVKAFDLVGWSLSEPTEMIGGELGDGFSDLEDLTD
jgi:hypothetical protein